MLDRGTTILSDSSDQGSDDEFDQNTARVPGGVYTESHVMVEDNEYAEGRELGEGDDMQD